MQQGGGGFDHSVFRVSDGSCLVRGKELQSIPVIMENFEIEGIGEQRGLWNSEIDSVDSLGRGVRWLLLVIAWSCRSIITRGDSIFRKYFWRALAYM